MCTIVYVVCFFAIDSLVQIDGINLNGITDNNKHNKFDQHSAANKFHCNFFVNFYSVNTCPVISKQKNILATNLFDSIGELAVE